MKKTAIVVPCYNEADRLDRTAFTEAVDRDATLHVRFVNDGSADNTQRVLETVSATRPERMRVIALDRNSGKAEAVRRGIVEAMGEGFDYIGYWDADLSTPLSAVANLRGILESNPAADVVLSSRVRLLGKNIERKAMRHYLGRVFATFASLALDLPVYDTQCGAKLFRNGELLGAVFTEPFMTGWIFDVEALARFILAYRARNGATPAGAIIECPLQQWRDVGGSKLKWTHLPFIAKDMFTLAWHYSSRLYRKR